MAEEGDEQLTASDYASDMDVEEDVDVGPSTSTSMHRVPVTLGEAVAKVRTLVRATRNGSQRRLMYAKLCADLNMSNNNLLKLDCPTRWNNTYDMLRAAIERGPSWMKEHPISRQMGGRRRYQRTSGNYYGYLLIY